MAATNTISQKFIPVIPSDVPAQLGLVLKIASAANIPIAIGYIAK